jgi:hypothetical protein
MDTLFKIFQLPIITLNLFGFIGSGIWLLVIGQWRAVVAGILSAFFAHFALGLALLPGLAFAGPGVYFAQRRITIGVYFFGFLSSLYTYVLITAWCGTVAFYFLHDAPSAAFWPLLIWSYGVATSEWTYMAQRDQSIAGFLAAFFAQVAFIAMMLAMAFGVGLASGLQAFALVMVVGVFFHMRMLAEMQRAEMLQAE